MATATIPKKVGIILYYLLIFLFILFPFGQFTTVPLPTPDIHLYLQDLILLMIWFVLIAAFRSDRKILLKIPLAKAIGLFIPIALLSLFANVNALSFAQFFISSLYLARWLGFVGVYLGTYIVLKNYPQKKEQMTNYFILSILFTALFGVIQYFLYPDLRNLYYLGWDPHYYRIFGTFFDPGFIGLVLVIGLLIIFAENLKRPILWQVISAIIILIALVLTYSRSSFLAFFVSIIYLTISWKKWKILALILIMSVLIYIFLPKPPHSEGANLGRNTSSQARLGSWQEGLNLFKKSPLLGVGFNTLKFTRKSLPDQYFQNVPIASHSEAGLENSFIFILATTGIVGFIVYIYLLLKFFISIDLVGKVSLISIIIHSFFNNSLFYPWIMFILWYIVASNLRRYD